MGMTPNQFFFSFVSPNKWDCDENPGCIRRAFNASVSVSHFLDQYYEYQKRHNPDLVSSFNNIGEFVEHISRETNNTFKDIRSLSNAYKHLYTDNQSKFGAHSSVNSSGSIEVINFHGDDNLNTIEEDYSDDVEFKIIFTRKDGSKGDFQKTLNTVYDYLLDIAYKSA